LHALLIHNIFLLTHSQFHQIFLKVRKYPMFTLGAAKDLSLKQRTLDWALKSGEVKTQDTFYPIGSVASNAVGAELAWKYFQEVRVCSMNCLFDCVVACFPLSIADSETGTQSSAYVPV